MKQINQNFWTRLPVVLCGVFISCLLWASAFPSIKIGYRLFAIKSNDFASQMLFAGIRFATAGFLVLIFGSISEKKIMLPGRNSITVIIVLMLFKVIGQYVFFYIGLANTSAVNSSIINSSNVFIAILLSCFVFRLERSSFLKILGCIIGFAGIMLIQLRGKSIDTNLTLLGDGSCFLAAASNAFGTIYTKKLGKNINALLFTGYSFLFGGIVLGIAGFMFGGSFWSENYRAWLLLLHLALISTVAYSIWNILLKYNQVSRIAIFGFMNTLFSVILSALLLKEYAEAFNLYTLCSLIMVTAGIILVYCRKKI